MKIKRFVILLSSLALVIIGLLLLFTGEEENDVFSYSERSQEKNHESDEVHGDKGGRFFDEITLTDEEKARLASLIMVVQMAVSYKECPEHFDRVVDQALKSFAISVVVKDK